MPNASPPADALDAAQLRAWRGLLQVHATVTQALDAQMRSEHGLTLSSYEVLVVLANAPHGRLRMADIADRVLLSRSGLTRLVDRLVELGRQQTDDVLTVIERLVPGGGSVARAVRQMERSRRGGDGDGDGEGELAIAGYDELTAAQVTAKLEGLSAADLRAVREHERRNANRKSVLAAVDKRLG